MRFYEREGGGLGPCAAQTWPDPARCDLYCGLKRVAVRGVQPSLLASISGVTMADGEWYPLPGTEFKIPMPPKDLYMALITVFLFLPIVVICQWLVPFNKNPYKRPAKAE